MHVIRRDEKKYLRMPYIIKATGEFNKTKADFDAQNKNLDDKTKKSLKLSS